MNPTGGINIDKTLQQRPSCANNCGWSACLCTKAQNVTLFWSTGLWDTHGWTHSPQGDNFISENKEESWKNTERDSIRIKTIEIPLVYFITKIKSVRVSPFHGEWIILLLVFYWRWAFKHVVKAPPQYCLCWISVLMCQMCAIPL